MSQKTANHENRVRECNDILDTHLKDGARHVDGKLLKLGM